MNTILLAIHFHNYICIPSNSLNFQKFKSNSWKCFFHLPFKSVSFLRYKIVGFSTNLPALAEKYFIPSPTLWGNGRPDIPAQIEGVDYSCPALRLWGDLFTLIGNFWHWVLHGGVTANKWAFQGRGREGTVNKVWKFKNQQEPIRIWEWIFVREDSWFIQYVQFTSLDFALLKRTICFPCVSCTSGV